MKKFMFLFTVALALGLVMPLTANANQITCDDDKKKVALAENEKFEEIQVSELPAEVSEAVTKEYADYTIEKAYRGNDGSYKVSVSKEDEKFEVIVNDEGSLSKVESPKA